MDKQTDVQILKILRDKEWEEAQQGKSQDYIDGMNFTLLFWLNWEADLFRYFVRRDKPAE